MAYYKLGNLHYHGMGVEANEKKATHFFELGAMRGDVEARYNLGALEENAGNRRQA